LQFGVVRGYKEAIRDGGVSLDSEDRIVVVGAQTNPYHMVANTRYAVSLSIDKRAQPRTARRRPFESSRS